MPDLAASVDGALGASIGTIAVLSLADGSVLTGVSGVVAFSNRGPPLAPIGDLDGDGIIDLVATNLNETVGSFAFAGVVRLLSGATLKTIAQFDGSASLEFLHLLGVPGDVDGDGAEDLVIAPETTDICWCWSGRTQRELYALQSPGPDFHHAACGADLDGDGLAEIVASQQSGAGLVTVDRGRAVFLTVEPMLRPNNVGWPGVPPSLPQPPGLNGTPSPPAPPTNPPSLGGGLSGWTFAFQATNLLPGSAVSLVLTEYQGAPCNLTLETATVDGAGEWDGAFALVPPLSGSHVYGVQLVGTDRAGVAVTTAIERFACW